MSKNANHRDRGAGRQNRQAEGWPPQPRSFQWLSPSALLKPGPKSRILSLSLLLCGQLLILVPFITSIKAETPTQKQLEHCVEAIEVKMRDVYLTADGINRARQQATNNWQSKARGKYGSPYELWHNAKAKEAKCQRIGFGNDQKGAIGATIVCHLKAIPCARLIKGTRLTPLNGKKNQQDTDH